MLQAKQVSGTYLEVSNIMVKPEFKVIIAGGRDFMDLGSLILFADANLKEKAKTHEIVILSGKAKGADNAGEACWDSVSGGTEDMIRLARIHNLPTRILEY